LAPFIGDLAFFYLAWTFGRVRSLSVGDQGSWRCVVGLRAQRWRRRTGRRQPAPTARPATAAPPAWPLLVVVRMTTGVLVKEVVGAVRHERLFADIRLRSTAGRGRHAANGIHPLDEGGPRQPITARW